MKMPSKFVLKGLVVNRIFNKNNFYSSCMASLRCKLFNDKTSLEIRYEFWAKINRPEILTLGELLS